MVLHDLEGTKMENATILLVEDNGDDELLTLRALKKSNIGNKVYVARDGVEALDFLFCTNTYADRDPCDLPRIVLLDIKLPKLDGLEVLRRIRANEHTHFLPVVMLTSSDEEQDLIESYKGGANSYMRKPVDFTQFTASIRDLGLYWLVLNAPPPA
jgi:two-component system response regulator